MAAIQEAGATGFLDPEIKMEEQDPVDLEAEEIKAEAALPKMGSSRGETGRTVKQEPEEESSGAWGAELEVLMETLQPSHLAGETLQQPDPEMPQVLPEGVTEANKWPKGFWVSPRQPHLSRGATEDDKSHLDAMHTVTGKEGMPGKGTVESEMQRRRFRMLSYREANGPQELCRQLQELCRKWLVPERHTKEQMLELVTLEQFLAVLPLGMQKWLREHKPETCAQAVTLAEDFLLKQRGARGWKGQVKVKRMSKEEFVNSPKAKEAQPSTTKMKLLTETEHKHNGDDDLLGGTGLTEMEEPKPLLKNLEETKQLMTSMKTCKENNSLCQGELYKKQQWADKDNGNGKKAEDQFVSSQGVCRSISEPNVWDEENEVKYNKNGKKYTENSHLITPEGADVEEKPYKCWHCGQSFNSSSNLLTHERTHVGERLYKCSHCGESERTHIGQKPRECSHCGSTFGWSPQDKIQAEENPHAKCGKSCCQRSDVLKRKRIHRGMKQLKCSYCGKCFRQRQGLIYHERIHTGEKPCKCLVCGRNFRAITNLRSHLKTHARGKPYKCPHCDETFRRSSHLVFHEKIHRTETDERTHVGKKLFKCSHCGESERMHTGQKPHKCSRCGNTFGWNPQDKIQTEGKQYTECGKSCSQRADILKHKRTHIGMKQLKCSYCGKCFRQRQGLIYHERIHTGEKPCKCLVCGRNFRAITNLRSHLKTHTGVKPYKCSHCDKTFRWSSHLVFHEKNHTGGMHKRTHVGKKLFKCSSCGESERIHKGQKPHRCSNCGNTFAWNPQSKIQAGEKQYTCSECGKICSQKSDLLKHQRTHTGIKQHKCSECGKTFRWKSHLILHERIHTGQSSYICTDCGNSFTSISVLLRHQKMHDLVNFGFDNL